MRSPRAPRPHRPVRRRAARGAGAGWRAVPLALGLLLSFAGGAAQAADLSISCGALGQELRLCQDAVDAWSRKTGHRVQVVSTPNSATERLALYQQILAARSSDIDIMQIDVVWPGTLAPHLVDLSQYIGPGTTATHFKSLIDNDTVDGALVAMPWFTDAGVLFYRKDLLEKYNEPVPKTWTELTRIARRIQNAERAAGHARMQGFVFQAKGYEGLTCNALEWIDSFGGGTLVDDHGAITVDNPRAAAALDLAASWIGDIAPEGVLNYDEEQSRGVFQSSNAVFMRNWPYAWALANAEDSPIRGQVGVTALPAGGTDGHPSGVLGGWQLAVSKYSAHPALAADLVRHLTAASEQKRRAVIGAYNPTIPALYRDPEVLDAVPFFGQLYTSFEHAVARPSRITGSKYNRVSAAFYNTVHDILARRQPAEPQLRALAQRRLQRLSRDGQW
ncbi:ABC transporter substrate-binding protein [Sinimarinibacterium sp. CAU 1509]|uniref:ABC transporter substrate-binding protein n=1 Tax=Sinimarinibacterium sp. CAU 1509 TaxID=2562283 RepID=UPI0010ABDB2D|nr:ABC transporter substrate-binding protein [Sinimarinibacterium sp. CAU 1509]TJY58199.1 ABC transporter substrate-binding protein [Sinimarinibacterium sp. CAU 1509]